MTQRIGLMDKLLQVTGWPQEGKCPALTSLSAECWWLWISALCRMSVRRTWLRQQRHPCFISFPSLPSAFLSSLFLLSPPLSLSLLFFPSLCSSLLSFPPRSTFCLLSFTFPFFALLSFLPSLSSLLLSFFFPFLSPLLLSSPLLSGPAQPLLMGWQLPVLHHLALQRLWWFFLWGAALWTRGLFWVFFFLGGGGWTYVCVACVCVCIVWCGMLIEKLVPFLLVLPLPYHHHHHHHHHRRHYYQKQHQLNAKQTCLLNNWGSQAGAASD